MTGNQRGTIRIILDMDTIKPQLNEAFLRHKNHWLHFAHPHRLIVAAKPEEVVPALREIEDLVERNGWHAAGFLSYEAAAAFDKAHQTRPESGFPLLWFGLYPAPRIMTKPEPEIGRAHV